jgi:hypothetical protein
MAFFAIKSSSDPYGGLSMATLRVFVIPLGILTVVSLMSSGCATVMHGSTEGVYFTSDPDKAKVYINGELKGTTPVQLELASKNAYAVEFRKSGYDPKKVTLTNGVGGGWVVLDIVFLLVPLAIDAATGCWYTFDDVHIRGVLDPSEKGALSAPAEPVLQTGPPSKDYSRLGTGHWVKKTMDNGIMVVLDDNSLWEVQASDVSTTATWTQGTPISVGVSKGDYPYQLIDVSTSKAVVAKWVGQR